MNYNFMADCQSRGFDETYLTILSILNEKFTFKPGCVEKDLNELNEYKIGGEDISVFIAFDCDGNTLSSKMYSRSIMYDTSVGYFNLRLEYKDGLSFPMIYGTMCSKYGYFRFDNIFDEEDKKVSTDGIMVSYYDNESVIYLSKNGGSFQSHFIEPDKKFILLNDDETIEKVLALVICGKYDEEIEEVIENSHKVYCKKVSI